MKNKVFYGVLGILFIVGLVFGISYMGPEAQVTRSSSGTEGPIDSQMLESIQAHMEDLLLQNKHDEAVSEFKKVNTALRSHLSDQNMEHIVMAHTMLVKNAEFLMKHLDKFGYGVLSDNDLINALELPSPMDLYHEGVARQVEDLDPTQLEFYKAELIENQEKMDQIFKEFQAQH